MNNTKPSFEQRAKPPKGWQDIGSPMIFLRDTKKGPKYLCLGL